MLLDGRHLTLASFLVYVVCTQLILDLHKKLNEQLNIIMHKPCQLFKKFYIYMIKNKIYF
ncbi:hypothetical protein PROVRETT_09697 [Providencia rettgeri DSM 1131]|uniref:Uncharacterized protein n=1 Tax=Providencia rettgeri TaxID=587 RepID=A0A264VSV9_PRORE|nr:hypothetical protein PROVRETT_09697 [Providencia rettgeri DSM 1131]OZS74414.1 hypothetical protein CHI95_11565 [Providencia rettgeri]PYZ59898.1 hypothetical protein DNK63_12605 [Providencia rettgeri]